jgi:YD repeat-containing protein
MDGSRITTAYDSLGRRTTVQHAVGTTTLAYDPRNLLVGRTDPGAIVQAYTWDGARRRISVKDPDAALQTYVYDSVGNLAKFTDNANSVTTLQYDALSRNTTVIFGEGSKRTIKYDAVGQITAIAEQTSVGADLMRTSFTYDAVGNRKSAQRNTGMLSTYTMDAKNRLTKEETSIESAHTYDYSYNAVDDLLNSTESGSLVQFTVDAASRLITSVSGSVTTTYSFDLNGNMIGVQDSLGQTTMVYDKENRLTLHQSPTGSVATYAYGLDGLKTTENVDGVLTTIVWDGSDYLAEG